MNQIVGQIIFGLPFLVESFVNGYAIIPALICATLVPSNNLKTGMKLLIAGTVLFVTAFYLANLDFIITVSLTLLMLPAVVVWATAFAIAFRMLRTLAKKYDDRLDGQPNA